MLIRTVKHLKEFIAELPDDMQVYGYDGVDIARLISVWILKADEVEDENFTKDVLTISTD
jgi:hypothetical protein